MAAAQEHKVGHAGLTALGPVTDVVTIHEPALRASREAAAAIP